jgi:hypothetical protein
MVTLDQNFEGPNADINFVDFLHRQVLGDWLPIKFLRSTSPIGNQTKCLRIPLVTYLSASS